MKDKLEIQPESRSQLAQRDFLKPLGEMGLQKSAFGVGANCEYSCLLFADNPYVMSCLKRDFAKLSEAVAS